MRERDYAQGVYDAYQAWTAVRDSQKDFILDPSAPPPEPPTVSERFPSCKDEYKGDNGSIPLFGAFCRGIADGGILGGAESKALQALVDAITNYSVRKTSTGA